MLTSVRILIFAFWTFGFVLSASAAPGDITTVAGGGVGDGGAATDAGISPSSIFVDGEGNLYIVDTANQRIRKVDPSGIITTVVGDGFKILEPDLGILGRFSGDGGPATLASLSVPTGVFVDGSGNLYIADSANQRIRKVDLSGTITTVAGDGFQVAVEAVGVLGRFSGDGGPATLASLSVPTGVFVDGSGNLYIADSANQRIRKVDAKTGIITTVAGNGERGFSGDGGPATDASLRSPSDIFVDGSGNLYIADARHHRVRKVDTLGIITTVAGNGERGFSGDGGPATSASLAAPQGVFVDGSGNLYIADRRNHRIRKVDAATGIITTVAGNGIEGSSGDGGPATEASLQRPSNVFVDGLGNLYIADWDNNRVRKVDTSGIITTVAGNGERGFSGDGVRATNTSLNLPAGVFVDGSGNLYIADARHHRVRKVDAKSGTITTVAGDGFKDEYSELGRFSGDGGPATLASLSEPASVFVDDSGNLYIADSDNNRIRKVDAKSGIITTVAGSGYPGPFGKGFSGDGGAATEAGLLFPSDVFVDGSANLYIADLGNYRVRKVDAKSGTITTVVGNGKYGFSGDGGPAVLASLFCPFGVFVDDSGNLYIADSGNPRIRKVDASGTITTVVGNGKYGFSGDGGPAVLASLSEPYGIFMDGSGNLYIADGLNHRIRKVDPSGTITTVAGSGSPSVSPFGDGGPATLAGLFSPFGVFVDGVGNLYIADTGNHRIRKVEGIAAPSTLVVGVYTPPPDTVPPAVVASSLEDDAKDIDPAAVNKAGIFIRFNEPIDTVRIQINVKAGDKALAWQPTWTAGGIMLILTPVEGGELDFEAEYRVIFSQVVDRAGNTAEEIVIAFTTQEAPKTPDFNGDGTVDFQDFLEFAQNFGKKQGDSDFDTKYDLDDSGSVDFADFIEFAQNFGKSG